MEFNKIISKNILDQPNNSKENIYYILNYFIFKILNIIGNCFFKMA